MSNHFDEDSEDKIKDEGRGFFIALISLAVVSLIVVIALFSFFPQEESPSLEPRLSSSTRAKSNEDEEIPSPLDDSMSWLTNTDTPKETAGSFGVEVNSSNTSQQQALVVEKAAPLLPETKAPLQTTPVPSPPPPPPSAPKASSSPPPQTPPKESIATNSSNRENVYWIQVGSYKNRAIAESVLDRLTKDSYPASLFSHMDNNTELVRVRLGPWKTKSEAEAVLLRLRSHPDLSESYVTLAPGVAP